MILKRNFNPLKVFSYIWRETLFALMLSTAVYVAFAHFDLKFIAFPIAPLTILGTAIAIFLAFRNNTSYTRWWEARTLWANLSGNSRIFTRQIVANVDNALSLGKGGDAKSVEAYKREMVYRQIAFAHALRIHLRGQATWRDLLPFLNSEEYAQLLTKANKPNWLLQTQGKRIKDGIKQEILGAFDNITLEPQLAAFNNWQTLCERLKQTPVLRQYDYFSRTFVWTFIALFPFSLIELFKSMPSMVIPFSVLLAFVFAMVQRIGEVNEEPFENNIQDVPMSAICNQIERDLREQLGESELPAAIEPKDGYLF